MLENKDNFSKNLIDKIKEEKIEPKPRWHFLLKNYVVWFSGLASLIFGSLATSVIIYLIKHNNWQLGQESEGLISFFLITLPYFWLLFLIIFILVIFYNLKHTKKGYKYKAVHIILVAILSSILLGEVFYLVGLGKKIDDVLGTRAPFYKEMFNPHLHYFCNPEKGRLSGVLIIENNETALIDPSGNYWEIIFKDKKIIPGTFSSGQIVNALGSIIEDDNRLFEIYVIKVNDSGQEFIRRFRDMPCPNNDCVLPPELNNLKNKWPDKYFQRFPEKPNEGLEINNIIE